jgi:uncharacterized delta-60 repeat protein
MSNDRPLVRILRKALLRSGALALLIVAMAALPAQAAAGDLDTTFGNGGTVITIMPNKGWGNQIAIQPDGKLVVAGFNGKDPVTDMAVVRYNTDGSLDTTFGGTGIVTTDFGGQDYARAIALQADGKIIAAGSGGVNKDFALARYNTDGTLDTTFGTGGMVTTDFGGTDAIRALLVRPSDKKIVAVGFHGSTGNFDWALARYFPNGTLDTTFGTGGTVLTDFGGVDQTRGAVLVRGGKMVVAGMTKSSNTKSDFALARYNQNGTLDTTFGTGGKVTTDFGAFDLARAIVLQPDGKVVAGGYSGCCGGGSPAIKGQYDPDLAQDGLAPNTASDFAIARYNTNGSLDTTFGPDGTGKVIADLFGNADHARALALQSDGKLVQAGNSATLTGTLVDSTAVVRYNADGTLDTTFGNGGIVLTDIAPGLQEGARDVKVQADGKIVTAGIVGATSGGGFEYALARYLGS